jgi:hypothetical protein
LSAGESLLEQLQCSISFRGCVFFDETNHAELANSLLRSTPATILPRAAGCSGQSNSAFFRTADTAKEANLAPIAAQIFF